MQERGKQEELLVLHCKAAFGFDDPTLAEQHELSAGRESATDDVPFFERDGKRWD